MSRIRSSKTEPELLLRSALWSRGLRYRLKHPAAAGRPDIVFARRKLAVFVDGCFWHGCPIHGTSPKTNRSYWSPKLQRNRERDIEVTTALKAAGWDVLRYWEHEIYDALDVVARKIERAARQPHGGKNKAHGSDRARAVSR